MNLLFSLLIFSLLLGCGEGVRLSPINNLATYEKYQGGYCAGLSAFALMSDNYDEETCENFLKIQANSICTATAILWGSFGNNTSCLYRYLDQVLELNQPIVIEVHFSCEVCRKNSNSNEFNFLGDHSLIDISLTLEEMSPATKEQIQKRIDEILDTFKPYENYIYLILSTGLEDQYSIKARANLTQVFLEHGGDFEIAWNPDNSISIPSGVYGEYHHYGAIPFGTKSIINGDGQDMSLFSGDGITLSGKQPATMPAVMDFLRRGKGSGAITLLWNARSQGIKEVTIPTLNRKVEITDMDAMVLSDLLNEIQR